MVVRVFTYDLKLHCYLQQTLCLRQGAGTEVFTSDLSQDAGTGAFTCRNVACANQTPPVSPQTRPGKYLQTYSQGKQ